jgi:hypothetical protein
MDATVCADVPKSAPWAGFVVNTMLPEAAVRSAMEKAIGEVDGDLL